MRQNECHEIKSLLIDYSDGELGEEKSRIVEHHLTKCSSCRKHLGDLQKSLYIVKGLWQENLAEIEDIEISLPVKVKQHTNWKYAAIAAGLLIAAGIFSVTIRQDQQRRSEIMTAEQVEREITESASALRLLATADMLREYDDAKDILRKLYQNIIATYPDTKAAMEAKSRIKSLI